jgi:mannose-6-phosphate isomerase-like protein (cupin superfamily)
MNTAAFTIPELSKQQRESDSPWLEFLNLPSLSMGVYHIPAGTNDRESHDPHDRDEIYVGSTGKGQLTAGGKEFDVEAGVIVYVKAGVEHHFHDVADDLTVLVFFAGNADN